MKNKYRFRRSCAVSMLATPFLAALVAAPCAAAETRQAATTQTHPVAATPFVRNGRAGFVVSHIRYGLGSDGAADSNACPEGLSLHMAEIYARSAAGKRRDDEADGDYSKRLEEGARALSTGPNGEDLCLNPEVAPPDPHARTVAGSGIPVYGIDLDPPGAVSGDDDFLGVDGEAGIDNQFYRLVGCTRSYQPDGASNGFEVEMYTGSWGILFTLDGIDDFYNDDEVEVGIYANADPIQLSPTREALAYATYAMDQDPRYRAETTGQIKDGVLITKPVDIRLHHVVNSIRLDRTLNEARLQLNVGADGSLSGYMAGYTPAEDLYDYQFGFRNGRGADGQPAVLRLRSGSSNGAARVLGYTCPGIYHSIYKLADGLPDPETGKFTGLSTQYLIEAIPAFVVDVATASQNQGLKEKLRFDDAN